MPGLPHDPPTKDQIRNKVLTDLESMAENCKAGGFKNLKQYIERVLRDLKEGGFPEYPFLDAALDKLYEDYWSSRFFKWAIKKQFWDYATIYFSIHDAADRLRAEFQYKQVLESALDRKQPDMDKLSGQIDRHCNEFNKYVWNLNWSLLTRNAKFKLTTQAILDLWENYYEVCRKQLVFELGKYIDNDDKDYKKNRIAHEILKYKKMCGYKSDVHELRNSIAHSCGVKREGKLITFALFDKPQEELKYDKKEFYYLPFFIVEKTRFVFAVMMLIHLDTGIRLFRNYDSIVFDR